MSDYKQPLKKNVTSYFVRVEVDVNKYSSTPIVEQEKNNCEDVIEQIKRHVDGLYHVEMDCDLEVVCEFCGRKYDGTTNGPIQCCQEEINHWISANMDAAKASGDWGAEIENLSKAIAPEGKG